MSFPIIFRRRQQATSAEAPLLLDSVSGALVAYSFRKLKSTATSAVRIRRSSDNAEADIGFSGSDFDSAAFTAHVGGGTGDGRSFYDQTGNDIHAGQATEASQPQAVLSVLNSRPVFRFNGVSDFFDIASLGSPSSLDIFVVVKIVTDPPISSGRTGLWHLGTGTITAFPWTDGVIYDTAGTNDRKTTVDPTPALTSWRLYNVTSASGEWTSRIDGTQIFTTATNTVATPASPRLGAASATGLLDGDIAEFLIFPKLSAGDRNLVEADIASAYNLTIA